MLFVGLSAMSGAMAFFSELDSVKNFLAMFRNPLLLVLIGAILTAVVQSSSVMTSMTITMVVTGLISLNQGIYITMGANIGTCVTAMISSISANKNAKRAAMVHLSFNVIGTIVWLIVFWLIKIWFVPAFLEDAASLLGIAVAHSIFNILCTLLMLPLSGMLEKLVIRLVPDDETQETWTELDERLLAAPPIALKRCR